VGDVNGVAPPLGLDIGMTFSTGVTARLMVWDPGGRLPSKTA